jgi:hypothetical protein
MGSPLKSTGTVARVGGTGQRQYAATGWRPRSDGPDRLGRPFHLLRRVPASLPSDASGWLHAYDICRMCGGTTGSTRHALASGAVRAEEWGGKVGGQGADRASGVEVAGAAADRE